MSTTNAVNQAKKRKKEQIMIRNGRRVTVFKAIYQQNIIHSGSCQHEQVLATNSNLGNLPFREFQRTVVILERIDAGFYKRCSSEKRLLVLPASFDSRHSHLANACVQRNYSEICILLGLQGYGGLEVLNRNSAVTIILECITNDYIVS